MLTAKADEESILKGLDIGADDYVTKPFSPRQIVARVNAVLRRTQGDTIASAKEYFFDSRTLRYYYRKLQTRCYAVAGFEL